MKADVFTERAFRRSLAEYRVLRGEKPARVELNVDGCRQMARWCLYAEYDDHFQIMAELSDPDGDERLAMRRHFDGAVCLGVPVVLRPDARPLARFVA